MLDNWQNHWKYSLLLCQALILSLGSHGEVSQYILLCQKGDSMPGMLLSHVAVPCPSSLHSEHSHSKLSWGSAQGLMDTAPWARHLSKAGCTSKPLWGSAQRNKPCSAVVLAQWQTEEADVRLNRRHSCTVQRKLLIANRENFTLRYVMRILGGRPREAPVLLCCVGRAEVEQATQGGCEICSRRTSVLC